MLSITIHDDKKEKRYSFSAEITYYNYNVGEIFIIGYGASEIEAVDNLYKEILVIINGLNELLESEKKFKHLHDLG